MLKRIISCILSTIIVLGATIAYDRTPACRIAVMEQIPAQLGAVLPRAAAYELELTVEEQSRTYTVNCFDKDGGKFRSYSILTTEGSDEPLHYTRTDYTYDETTGIFATLPGRITVPAATYTQAEDGTWVTTPGTAVLTVTGTV